ncbi:hypothetical protein TNIN_443871 [Trichonephila inaurata madagascariensis]|uniref:Uncharacterized protein n=1 Tax=Trichonephila inaurata madagascariensis TaxID=2747483 RepID=A0A8X6I4W5_9ARAC|nr:hypothetical protein TNIN_443871 [Trichonephila inaurata madagascariensis]
MSNFKNCTRMETTLSKQFLPRVREGEGLSKARGNVVSCTLLFRSGAEVRDDGKRSSVAAPHAMDTASSEALKSVAQLKYQTRNIYERVGRIGYNEINYLKLECGHTYC